MSAGDESCFVTSIVLDGVNKVYSDLLVSRTGSISLSFVVEGFVFVDLCKLKDLCVSPLGVAVACVELHCLLMIAWNLKTVHVDRFSAKGM